MHQSRDNGMRELVNKILNARTVNEWKYIECFIHKS